MTTNAGTIIVIGDGTNYVHGFSVNYNGPANSQGTPLWAYNTRKDIAPPGYSQYCQPAPQLCGDSVWSSPAEGLVTVNGEFIIMHILDLEQVHQVAWDVLMLLTLIAL